MVWIFRDSETNAAISGEIPTNWGRLMFDDLTNPVPPPFQPDNFSL